MKRLLLFTLTALVMFGLSAFVSWKLYPSKPPAEASAEEEPKVADRGGPSGRGSASRPASSLNLVRPAPTPATEEVTQLAASLRKRLAAVHEKEAQQATRQRILDLVQQDIRTERAALEELRKQAAAELKKAEEILTKVERKTPSPPSHEEDPPDATVEKLPVPREVKEEVKEEKVEDYSKAADLFRSLPPPNAAEMLEDLAKAGKLDTAVKLLAAIPARQAARVLSEVTAPGLAEKLLERQKKRKPLPLPAPKVNAPKP